VPEDELAHAALRCGVHGVKGLCSRQHCRHRLRATMRTPGDKAQRMGPIKAWPPHQRHELIVQLGHASEQVGAIKPHVLGKPVDRL
jgi:hypothetical protein